MPGTEATAESEAVAAELEVGEDVEAEVECKGEAKICSVP